MNIGLTTKIVLSVLPVGLLQTWASLQHGYWYARSAELLGAGWMQTLRWLRAPPGARNRATRSPRNEMDGPPEVIAFEEIARPAPGDDEVLVRVKAAGVGPWDAWIRAGKSGRHGRRAPQRPSRPRERRA